MHTVVGFIVFPVEGFCLHRTRGHASSSLGRRRFPPGLVLLLRCRRRWGFFSEIEQRSRQPTNGCLFPLVEIYRGFIHSLAGPQLAVGVIDHVRDAMAVLAETLAVVGTIPVLATLGITPRRSGADSTGGSARGDRR